MNHHRRQSLPKDSPPEMKSVNRPHTSFMVVSNSWIQRSEVTALGVPRARTLTLLISPLRRGGAQSRYRLPLCRVSVFFIRGDQCSVSSTKRLNLSKASEHTSTVQKPENRGERAGGCRRGYRFQRYPCCGNTYDGAEKEREEDVKGSGWRCSRRGSRAVLAKLPEVQQVDRHLCEPEGRGATSE